ncbi:Modification methylase HpaII [Chlamydia trachomatis]|jgi:DNA (cytosine-5-)-methyltransferase|nr:Modification methylase HpaII [Chlamydia trachomatis]
MKNKLKFIDLFAGIGGFHQAFHNLGAECVFVSEWDDNARKTYEANYKNISPDLFKEENRDKLFVGDITKIDPKDIPDFDVLCAGFPCQPFSQAGFKKGFEDTRGTLFFNIAEILKEKKPKAFFLENVRGLLNHDKGNTMTVIKRVLEEELGYKIFYKVLKASDYGVPQNRPRLYIIGFREDVSFEFPKPIKLEKTMSDVFEGRAEREVGFTLRVGGRGSNINDRRNWDSYMVDGEVRRLTPKEGLRMQGFPDSFVFPVSEAQAMKQLGNSVAVPAIQATAKKMMEAMNVEI